ncbi:MAG: disulfide bond formation protein B [Stellaceae bacterium]
MARRLPLALLIASLAILGVALAFQFIGGLQPCEICLYERWPYDGVALLALLALIVGRRRVSRIVLVAAAAIFLAGTGLAAYHFGVERHWLPGPAACTAPTRQANSAAALEAQLEATPIVRCDRIQESPIGDLVAWNLAVSLILALCCAVAQTRLKETG